MEGDNCLHGGYAFDGEGSFISIKVKEDRGDPLPIYVPDGWGSYSLDGDRLILDIASDPYKEDKTNKVTAFIDILDRFLIMTQEKPGHLSEATIFSTCRKVIYRLAIRLLSIKRKAADKK